MFQHRLSAGVWQIWLMRQVRLGEVIMRSGTITFLFLLFIGSFGLRIEAQGQSINTVLRLKSGESISLPASVTNAKYEDPSTSKTSEADCCDELRQRVKTLELKNKELEERVKTVELRLKDQRTNEEQLEARLARLEQRLNGPDITLGEGGSSIRIGPAGVTINSSNITIKASGNLTLKGTRITSN
jgi:hypothetical protein